MKPTKELAREIATKIDGNHPWKTIRDVLDGQTGGELDCFQLDMLTDWVTHECDKRDGCDCQAPYNSIGGAELVSNSCPVHNTNPETHWDVEERHVMDACNAKGETDAGA
jgi:hypothetical protein